jgi:hypothetical protein
MKGIIWKYHAKTDAPDLRDEMGRTGCRVLNPDPDFWENGFPVWAVCGPMARARLEACDALFFVPTSETSRAAGVGESVCTGYLVVKEILPSDLALLADPRFTPRYKENYRVDLKAHLKDDPGRTRVQRQQNIIVGDPASSRWLGRKGVPMPKAIRDLGIRSLNLKVRLIRTLTGEEALALLGLIRDQPIQAKREDARKVR